MGLCDDFVEVHRRLAQLESLLPWEELPAPPAKRQCVTQVAVPEPLARPPPEPAEGCDSQSPSAVPSAQGGRCSKGHLLKRAVLGSGKGLVCDGPCGRSLRSNMARWSCATCDFDLCAAPPPPTTTARASVSLRPTPELIARIVVAGAQSAPAPSRPARHPAPPRQAGSGAGPAAVAAAAPLLLHARLRLRCRAHSRRRRHWPTRPPDRNHRRSRSSSRRSRRSRRSRSRSRSRRSRRSRRRGSRLPTARRPSTGWLSHSHRFRHARISRCRRRSRGQAHCRRRRRSRRRSRRSWRNLGTSSMCRLRRSPNRSRSRRPNHSCSRS